MVTDMRRHQEWDSQQDRQHKGLVTADEALFLKGDQDVRRLADDSK